MCHSYEFCGSCPLWGEPCIVTGIRSLTDSEFLTITSTVEQWSKEHPIITNAKKFEEVFGEKTIDQLALCETRTVGPNVPKLFIKPSSWWDEPYKETEHDRN